MYIYILTNEVNGKQYVGQSIHDPESPEGRLRCHKDGWGRNKETVIHQAIKKYEWDNFSYDIIHYSGASQKSLNAIEKWKIKSLRTLAPEGYNLKKGGNAGGKLSDVARKKRLGPIWECADEIREKYKTGKWSKAELARLYKCSSTKPIKNIVKGIVVEKVPKPAHNRHPCWEYSKEICDKYSEGKLTFTQLAELYGCSKTIISTILKKNNIKGIPKSTRNRKPNQPAHNRHPCWEHADEIRARYDSGERNISKLARFYGCSYKPIENILKKGTEIHG